MTLTFHCSPVARSSAALMAAPFVAMVAASCEGVNARTTGRSNDPMRGPVLAFGASLVVVAGVVPPQAAITRPAANTHPSGPRKDRRMGPSFKCWKRPYDRSRGVLPYQARGIVA